MSDKPAPKPGAPARSGAKPDQRTTDEVRVVESVANELVGAEVLVLDCDPAVHEGVEQLLLGSGLHLTCVSAPARALAVMEKRFFTVAIVDIDTPEPGAGLATIEEIKSRSPTSMVIMLTPRKSFVDAVAGMRAGAVDVILKSRDAVAYLKDRVVRAVDRSHGKRQVNALLEEVRDAHREYLERMLAAERRATDLQDQLTGSKPDGAPADVLWVMVVAEDRALADALTKGAPSGFQFDSVITGGEALDRCASSDYQVAFVAAALPDLPTSMVVQNIKAIAPGMIVLEQSDDGKVEIVEATRRIGFIYHWTSIEQLVERLPILAEGYRAKSRERRYGQVFRDRHADFLRRYVELKAKIDKLLGNVG